MSDYISEKLYNAIKCGTIPIVLGGKSPDYSKKLPKGSYIDIAELDGGSQADLQFPLEKISKNVTLYESYFQWRTINRDKTAIFLDEIAFPRLSTPHAQFCQLIHAPHRDQTADTSCVDDILNYL